MRSFLVLGDVSVHELDCGETLQHSLDVNSRFPRPRLYQGAAMAGQFTELALRSMDRDDEGDFLPFRMHRFLTPLEGADGASNSYSGPGEYPYDHYSNFPRSADPMREATTHWMLKGSKLRGKSDSERLRLTAEESTHAAATGVPSFRMLDALRVGGLFELGSSSGNEPLLHQVEETLEQAEQAWLSSLAYRCICESRGNAPDKSELSDTEKEDISRLTASLKRITAEGHAKNIPLPDLPANAEDFSEVVAQLHNYRMQLSLAKSGFGADKSEFDALMTVPDVVVLYDLHRSERVNSPKSPGSNDESEADAQIPEHRLRQCKIRSADPPNDDTAAGPENHPQFIVQAAWLRMLCGRLVYAFDAQIRSWSEDLDFEVGELQQKTRLTAIKSIHKVAKQIGGNSVPDRSHWELSKEKQSKTHQAWKKFIRSDDWHSGFTGRSADVAFQSPVRVHQAIISRTFRRLEEARSLAKKQSEVPIAEPLIICCLKSLKIPKLELCGEEPSDYLNTLYRQRWLRDRTVIIMDADYLRKLDSEPAGITSETSWEETVLDAVDAFQRRDTLKGYLDFGYIIVRFGVTGALLLSRDAGGELAVRLFFDPEKNDRDWTREDKGEVLGVTSIFTASIAQAMTFQCTKRKGQPILSDIPRALEHGLRLGIRACQQLAALAYGPAGAVRRPDSGEKNPELENTAWAAAFLKAVLHHNSATPLLFRTFKKPEINRIVAWVDSHCDGLDSKDKPGEAYALGENLKKCLGSRAPVIATSVIPTVRTLKWSIVEQSCSSELEYVAERIAQVGLSSALNQERRQTEDDCIDECCDSVAGFLKERLKGDFRCRLVAEASLRTTPDADDEYLQSQLEMASRELIKVVGQLFPEKPDEKNPVLKRIIKAMSSQRKELGCGNADKSPQVHSTAGRIMRLANEDILTAEDKLRTIVSQTDLSPDGRIRLLCRAVGRILRDVLSREGVFDIGGDRPQMKYCAPIGRFGSEGSQISYLDRREIEGVRAVERLISHYVKSQGEVEGARPLSIAVFGPPGSGKSTAVKKIAESFDGRLVYEGLEFNLSQLTGVEDLSKAFQKVKNEGGGSKIPLVFFDEFDSKLDSGTNPELGWLKYFLAPMEDGNFGEYSKLGPAVFIFAGATSYSFQNFAPKSLTPSDERWLPFVRAKGPDFVSRLSGHLNIMGIDPIDSDDELYLIRRAVLIRAFLESLNAVDPESKRARVDDPQVLRAILHAPAYRYGGRSLRMLINSCLSSDGHIRRCNIPAAHELDMMVDSKSFLATLRAPHA